MSSASRPPRSRPVKRAAGAAGGTRAARPAASSTRGPARNAGTAAKKAAAKPGRTTTASAHGGPARVAGRGSVSSSSARRFAARVRARRRRRVLIAVVALLVLAGPVWLALKSPWATVQRIEVTGTDRVALAQVRAAAGAEVGRPMLLARTADIEARVGRQRLVRSVEVTRHWPGTIRVRVTERVPVAALPNGSRLALVDRDGVVVEQVARAPAGLPRLQVPIGAEEVPALRGSLQVLQALPAALSGPLQTIGAESPDGIWLELKVSWLKKPARVEWGDSTQSAQKARVLLALLEQHGVRYDVRSPNNPAVTK